MIRSVLISQQFRSAWWKSDGSSISTWQLPLSGLSFYVTFPDLHRLAIWENSTAVNRSIELAEYSVPPIYGMEVLTIDARNPGEYEMAAQSNQWKADGLCRNPPAFNNRRIIIEIAARAG